MIKLAIILSHPIQYYSPLFTRLAASEQLQVKVFYTWNPNENANYDPGFNKNIEWDIPLLEGYDYTFSKNVSKDPGTHHYFGLDNPNLIDEITHWQPDALLLYGWKYKGHLQVLKYFRNKIPIFFRGDSHLLDEKHLVNNILRNVILKWIYRKIDFAFYTGKNNKAYFNKAGLNESQLIWVPHSVDNERFSSNEEESNRKAKELRNELSIPQDAVVVLYAGKMEKKKQPLMLLDIAVNSKNGKLHFIFAGNGEHEEEIKSAASKFENIHYLPFQNQSQMPVLYRSSDIFCLPSIREETWGLAVNEAMACGCAIIVSDRVGSAADLIHGGENGFVFNAENPEELKQILNLLKDEKQILKKLGENSKQIIKDWSIEKQTDAIESGIVNNVMKQDAQESFSTVK
ncbi:MAG: glycosyltransferase family 4 protein [Bacteroidia bacterium]